MVGGPPLSPPCGGGGAPHTCAPHHITSATLVERDEFSADEGSPRGAVSIGDLFHQYFVRFRCGLSGPSLRAKSARIIAKRADIVAQSDLIISSRLASKVRTAPERTHVIRRTARVRAIEDNPPE